MSSPYFEYFHSRYTRAELAVFPKREPRRFTFRNCQLPSVVKELRSGSLAARSSPLQAERGVGLEPRPRKIKNPTPSAGHFRPLPIVTRREDGLARNSTFFYPVFVTNLTSSRGGRLPARPASLRRETRRHQGSIAVPWASSSPVGFFFGGATVNFAQSCGKGPSGEVR